MKVKKAVIPAAGLGTRFLPVTKSMPKEMLPLIDTPAIHYVVKEAVEAGIDDIIIITGRGKRAVEDYFDDSPELEMHLIEKGKKDLLKTVREVSSMVNLHYIRQKEPKGLPDAVLKAEKHVGDEPFAVLLGDDIIKSKKPCIQQLIEVFNKFNSSVIAAQKVPMEKISRYGSIKGKEIETTMSNKIYLIEDIVEKPKPEKAPSNIASVGRYVFTPEIFDSIKETKPGVNNELQIADSIKILMQSQRVYASEFSGKRYDIGDKLGYVQAIIDFALENKEIGKNVKEYIKKIVS
ncbi:MAG TPA: UTP--glucose-1-phosphate uridylyltransferase GalU [Thermoplasmatales archaeon]|nr:UTP--glucose-1-phosphate uridylyltransferase GalU [Thermoplasmatales archaeon]